MYKVYIRTPTQCLASVHLNSELDIRSEYKVGGCGDNIGANAIVTVSAVQSGSATDENDTEIFANQIPQYLRAHLQHFNI